MTSIAAPLSGRSLIQQMSPTPEIAELRRREHLAWAALAVSRDRLDSLRDALEHARRTSSVSDANALRDRLAREGKETEALYSTAKSISRSLARAIAREYADELVRLAEAGDLVNLSAFRVFALARLNSSDYLADESVSTWFDRVNADDDALETIPAERFAWTVG